MYADKDPVQLSFTETLPKGDRIQSQVRIFKERVDGRELIVSVTESALLRVRCAADLRTGTPVATRITELGYEGAECRIRYEEERVFVEYEENGKVRSDSFANDRVLDGYMLSLLFSALPYQNWGEEDRDFQFLNYRKPSLIDVSLELVDPREEYRVNGTTVQAVHYRTRVNNVFIAMFTDPNHFYYGQREDTPVMFEYEGSDPSAIRSRIRYQLHPDSYRRAKRQFAGGE
jgi:hypothetical protein